MSDHNTSVFNNSCLKLPRNPRSAQPSPVYEQKYINQLKNEAEKMNLEVEELKKSKNPVKSFIEFVGSIPEYDQINHLSNREFYKKIELLKEKQRTFFEYLDNEQKVDWIEDYKNLSIGCRKKSSIKPFCATPLPKTTPIKELSESSSSSDKEVQPPSRRSVRIESPSLESLKKERGTWSASSKPDSSIDDFKFEERPFKSAPSSPVKTKPNVGWKDCGITIPKPFQMTVRDEENQIVEEILDKNTKPKTEKPEMFKAHPIPIESQIPLFDKIMSDQERKNQMVRRRRKALLQAQMQPFSFTRRDEELQNLTKEFSKSSPDIFFQVPPLKVKQFKAKPVPKNLFSNYIYKKMHEDEFYRALQKKIRAEEMLKAASLPPSMAKREKTSRKYNVCPRIFRDMDIQEKPKKPKKRIANSAQKLYQEEQIEKELEQLKNEFLATNANSIKIRPKPKKGKKNRSSSASSSDYSRTQSSLDLSGISRSNLAALLRIQSARNKIECDMVQKLEEAKLKEEARWKEKIMRKKPIWQTLTYSNEEDLAMRLQMRKNEEKLRSEEHKLRMQIMLGRVNQQPTLFERQSLVKYPKTRKDLVERLYSDYATNPKRCLSDLSDMVEVKDEAVQVLLDDDKYLSNSSKESLEEEKEKCECFDDSLLFNK